MLIQVLIQGSLFEVVSMPEDQFTPSPKSPLHTDPGYSALPLVYSCSGCSDVAQLANTLAVRLDREHFAEMSCIAGVGGGVRPLLRTAQSGRKVIALDGCPLHCAKHCLDQAGVAANLHIDLSKAGIRKRFHQDATPEEVERAWQSIVLPALALLDETVMRKRDDAGRTDGI
jgi:uncharacterized metal-binding protein